MRSGIYRLHKADIYKTKKFKLGIYQHYKGDMYEVRCIALHTETLEPVVCYKSLYGNLRNWVRPLSMFEEKVEYEGNVVDRFTFVSAPDEMLPEIRKD